MDFKPQPCEHRARARAAFAKSIVEAENLAQEFEDKGDHETAQSTRAVCNNLRECTRLRLKDYPETSS